jgi:Ca2+-binding RTX toxin-like protein
MVTWWDKGSALTDEHYFVKWRGVGETAEFGRVGDVLYPALGAPAPKFLTYAPSGTATAAVDGNTLTITVPKSGVGNPAVGDKIDNVTGYALSEKGPVPSVVDAAKSFSYTVGTPAGAEHKPDGYVEVSLDDPTFSDSVTAAMSAGEWSASLPAPSTAGSHTYYARQVLSADLYPNGLPDVAAGPVAETKLTVRVPNVSVGGATVTEGNTGQQDAAFTVSLNEASTDAVTVPYSASGVTAVSPEDFSSSAGEVTIPPGQTSATIDVPVNGDTEPEPTETFRLTLGTPQNATLATGVATGTIQDNDGMPRCTILGTEGNDVLKGTGGSDVICGFGGSDQIDGLQGNDVILGGAGTDTIIGGNGNDVLRGQERDDTLRGGNGDDVLIGGAGADSLFGETGADILNSSDGVFFNDANDGGTGTDNCAGDVGDRVTSCP